jgi:serine/threonine protein kinase
VVVPLTSVGPYQLLEPLDGNRLFLGLAPDGERVAVRVIEADVAADPRFRAEVAAARRVNGAFTTPVVAADLDADVPWLATAYVAGPTLADAVRDRGPAPAASLLLLASGLASGLRAIHDAGLVHGDLNPSNVLLDEDGPRITGFGVSGGAGLAGVAASDLGSPGFLAPEQALGQDAGPPSDVFSLGAVLVYAAGGQGPFGAGSSALLMYRLVNSPADLGRLPGELRSLVGRCLAKQPDRRPAASELVAELQAASASSVPSVASGSSVPSVSSPVSPTSLAGVAAGEPGRGEGEHSRRSWFRSRGPAWIATGVVAACAAAVFVLTGAVHLPTAGHVKPQAGVVAVEPDSTSQAPLILSSSPSVPGRSAPLRHSHSGHAAQVTPYRLQGPSASSFLSPSAPASGPSVSSTSASPSASSSSSGSPSASPSPSPSPSSSKSASPSPSPSPSPSVSSSSASSSPSSSASSSPSSSASSSA